MNKKKAIATICKSHGIGLYQQANDSTFISNGAVFYNLGKFPWCETEEELANVLGLTEKQLQAHTLEIINDNFPFEANRCLSEYQGVLNQTKYKIQSDIRTMSIFSLNKETVIVDDMFLKPFDDKDKTYELHEYSMGQKFIKVQYGILTAGYVLPVKINGKSDECFKEIISALTKIKNVEGKNEDV